MVEIGSKLLLTPSCTPQPGAQGLHVGLQTHTPSGHPGMSAGLGKLLRHEDEGRVGTTTGGATARLEVSRETVTSLEALQAAADITASQRNLHSSRMLS